MAAQLYAFQKSNDIFSTQLSKSIVKLTKTYLGLYQLPKILYTLSRSDNSFSTLQHALYYYHSISIKKVKDVVPVQFKFFFDLRLISKSLMLKSFLMNILTRWGDVSVHTQLELN